MVFQRLMRFGDELTLTRCDVLTIFCFLFLLVNQTGASGDPDRQLLDSVWGEVPKKMTTAIMGPSGAGALITVIWYLFRLPAYLLTIQLLFFNKI